MTSPRAAAHSGPRAGRCWTLHTADGSLDVEVRADTDGTLGTVLPALGRLVGGPADLWWGSAHLPEHTPLSHPALVHGAVLGLGRAGPRPTGGPRSSAVELHVTGGPDAGRALPLERGRHVVGRGTGSTVALTDPDVSRRHVEVQVAAGQITVADLGSTNGSHLDGDDLGGTPRPWPPGASLRIGATTMAVRGPGAAGATPDPVADGRFVVRSSPRLQVPRPEVEIAYPRRPEPVPARRLAWVAVALPAVAGATMAVVLHTTTFLFFAVLSPLAAVGTWLSDRWSGRRSRRREAATHALAMAAAEDQAVRALATDRTTAEVAHPDLAVLTAAARRRSSPLWSRRRDAPDAMTVRLGTGRGPTGVTQVSGDGTRSRCYEDGLPTAVDLRLTGGVGVVGPRRWALPVLAGVLAQVVALHEPGEAELVVLTTGDRLCDWTWARWLPHLDPCAAAPDDAQFDGALRSLLAGRRARRGAVPPWLVVVVDRSLPATIVERLLEGREHGVLTLAAAPSADLLPASVGAVVSATADVGSTATITRDGVEPVAVTVDRLPPDAAAALTRDLAALVPARSDAGLPREVRLLDEPGAPGLRMLRSGELGGSWLPGRGRLLALIGRTESEALTVDLCQAGPHALVAGTTGAGKSELLRTLVSSLALNHPPDRCSFLLVDYKGGAAFAEAASLPHTVGVVTDLDPSTTGRALRSLAAELTRRESLLSQHGVADLAELPESVDLARLVIVVDEFATLAEELPGFVPGLIGIAQRGRSLGVHLVLATQRPGGVVSPEIRANCTLRICLRTTDEADSRDVLGTADAAHLPLDRPGRAYLRAGTGEPVAFQVARVSAAIEEHGTPTVRRWTWPPREPDAPAAQVRAGATDLAQLAPALSGLARAQRRRDPHRPWLPPLPDRVPIEELGPPDGRRLPVGLVDRPEAQRRERLPLDLDDGGAWVALGGPRSGRTTLLRTVLAGAVAACSPDELHIHVLDHGGGGLAREAEALPQAGTCVGAGDPLRTVRLLHRLDEEVSARRAGGEGGPPPRVLLLVDGAEALMAQLDEADPLHGSAGFLRLLRDGAAVGLTCVATADRVVPGGRLASVARQRLVLPLADRADYAVAGIPPGAVPARRPPGRALVGESAAECQLAAPPGPLTSPHVRSGGPGPLAIPELPADPWLPRAAASPRPGSLPVSLGPGGDEGAPLVVDLARTGGLLIVGPPGSGRTATLDALAADLRAAGTPVLHLGGVRPGGGCSSADPGDPEAVTRWLDAHPDEITAVLADDVGAAPDWPALGALVARRSPPALLIAAGAAADLAGHYQGPVAVLRRARTGLLLCPGPVEADVLGIRLPRTPVPTRPGSGWLVDAGNVQRVQVARRRAE